MSLKNQLNEKLIIDDEIIKKSHFCIYRNDGIILYTNMNEDLNSSSLSALGAGLWSASLSLINNVFKNNEEEFRLDYSTSDTGIYILPIVTSHGSFLISYFYNQCQNPGLYKMKFRLFRDHIEKVFNSIEVETHRSGYLFNEISDEEIDKIFAVSGN